MFFDKRPVTEAIPERVFEVSRYVFEKGPVDKNIAKEVFEPSFIGDKTPYFYHYLGAAIELELIKEEKNILTFIAEEANIKDVDAFRKYCNGKLFKNDSYIFFRIVYSLLESNDKLFEIANIVDEKTKEFINKDWGVLIEKKELRGVRFWLSFLGFGYIQETVKIMFVPNMAVALKDFISLANFEKKTYTASEFFQKLNNVSSLIRPQVNKTLNLALSNGLRELELHNIIELEDKLDSKEKYKLYPSVVYDLNKFSHITYKGMKK